MTQHDNILIVPLPEDREWYFMTDVICLFNDTEKDIWIDLPPGPWRIVGRAKELTEEQWGRVVNCFGANGYFNYEVGTQYIEALLPTATESGFSLLRSHGIEPESNPLILVKEK